ncbi:zinc knuckle [Ostertagia ostertagi]
MVGPMTLRSQKGLVTRYCNALIRLTEEGKETTAQPGPTPNNATTYEEKHALLLEIEATAQLLLDTLSTFNATADTLVESLSQEEVKEVESYMDKAHEALERAHSVAFKMEATLRSRTQNFTGPLENQTRQNGACVQVAQPHDSAWKMQDLINALDDYITTEERINDVVERSVQKETQVGSMNSRKSKTQSSCMFCKADTHKSAACPRYPTLSERRAIMQEQKLCLNCGKQGHFVSQCFSKGCSHCDGKKHHHTLCPLRNSSASTPESMDQHPSQRYSPKSQKPKHAPPRTTVQVNRDTAPTNGPPQQNKPKRTQVHPVQSSTVDDTQQCFQTVQEANQDSLVLHHSEANSVDQGQVALLTGCAQVWSTLDTDWKEVEILFDTGADRSFISEALAQDLGLDRSNCRTLTMHTFGNREPKCAQSSLITLST